MNILYISKLEGKPWIGPTYSVPKQIASQRHFDNVFWYNLCSEPLAGSPENVLNWRKLDYYTDLSSHPDGKISTLPAPFNRPDLIVVEQGYPYARDAIRQEIIALGIPYIVIPRGELTASAQKKKRLKKLVGNLFFGYPKFMRHALAIQFLTEQENKETSKSWSKSRIVIPNGTDIPDNLTKTRMGDATSCVFIGRMEPYQKGIDLMIEAVAQIKDELLSAHFKIDLYGSDFEHKLDDLKRMVNDCGLSEIISFHDAIYSDEKAQLLKTADIFVIPSRFEGHPTGLLEALSYGLPCIATTGCNMRKEIDDAGAGWTADNSAESIKEAFLCAIREKDLINHKSQNARALAMQYDWVRIAEKAHTSYVTLLSALKQ